MARETKVGLIVGLGVILFVSVFVSDYLSVPESAEALTDVPTSNYVGSTTNQTEFVLRRENETDPATPIADPRDLAAVSLETIEERHGLPTYGTPQTPIDTPPFREAGQPLAHSIDDTTPIARDPLGQTPIDDDRLAIGHQLEPERLGPGASPDLHRVEIPEPILISAQPVTIEHTVKAGENLTAIARKYYDGDGNLWRSIRDANPGKVGANGEVVQGVTLTIPKRSTESTDPAGGLAEHAVAGNDRPQRQRVRMITVQEGDSLSELAAKHLGSAGKWQLIMDVNSDKLDKPEQLRAGMKLRIPAEPEVAVIEQANDALAVSTGGEPRVVAEVNDEQRSKTYTVKEGDSLYRIAQKILGDGERYDEIFQANKDKLGSADDIRVGMTLKMPSR